MVPNALPTLRMPQASPPQPTSYNPPVASLPASARFVVVGAGVHGLSTAYHLAEEGADVVVLDKSRVGAGATGISGGIVRNFYLSAAMNELVRRSVEIFELDPSLFGFRQVGYVAVVPEAQADELALIAEQHAAIGYHSTLIRGAAETTTAMEQLLPDWRATGSTAVLHETRSGWADAQTTVAALAGMARSAGARIVEGVEVTGFDGATVETTAGTIFCEALVIAPGPWARDLWRLLDLPAQLGARRAFHYWQVREGEFSATSAALDPRDPVIHLDADVAVDGMPTPWGIYFRPGIGGGVALGGLPLALDDDCELDPYGPSHPELGVTDPAFDAAVTGALSWALGRFDGAAWTGTSFAAQTCFTPDSYPIVGFVRDSVYALLDSNHGFKLLALGQLAATELLGGDEPALAPFRVARFDHAAQHPASASPYPWT
jgi:glycine/D-amino acid oxidase-like deaminating enzyme